MKEGLTKELFTFIVLHVDSVEFLEILTLIHSQPEREWRVADVDAVIRSNTQSLQTRLVYLVELGLASQTTDDPPTFRYAPSNEQMRHIGDDLVSAYQTRRVEVTELIYTKPMKEIVNFSNAFKLRGEDKDDG
jgi:hypothetical protein